MGDTVFAGKLFTLRLVNYLVLYIRRALQLQRVRAYFEQAPPSLVSSFLGLLGNVTVDMVRWLFAEAMNETSQASCDTYNVRPE